MGAGASTTEDQDLQVFVAMKATYEELKDGDEQAAFDAVKKVYVEKMAEVGASIEAAPAEEAPADAVDDAEAAAPAGGDAAVSAAAGDDAAGASPAEAEAAPAAEE